MGVPKARNSVCAVIVTFHPERALLQQLLVRIVPQVERLLIVNNGSPREVLVWLNEQQQHGTIDIIDLEDNLGVAAAHNRGIEWARTQGSDYVLLLDQDSVPATNMVERLLTALCSLQTEGESVAAVGPRYRDPRRPELPAFIRWGVLRAQRVHCPSGHWARPVAVDFLISSGMLIPLSVLARVGGMEEALFIDAVDFEWCLRVTDRGYRLYGVGNAEMCHSLGDRVKTIWFARTRRVSVRSPLRQYYFVRNSLLLYRRPYVSWAWVCQSLRVLIRMFALFSLFIPPRSQNAGMMARGFWHGIRGRSGRYDPESGLLTDLPIRPEPVAQPSTSVPGQGQAA
jgi:rhamnosyltransferase